MKRILFATLLFIAAQPGCHHTDVPFSVDPLFKFSQPETLGLSSAEGLSTVTIFSPGENDNKYNNGVILFPFRGKLFAQWQSSACDEDAPDTQVFYSFSDDGIIWNKPIALTDRLESCITTSGGWCSDGKTLVAYVSVWPNGSDGVKEGYTEYMTSTDGLHWEGSRPVTDADGKPVSGIIEQDVHALPKGRLITAFHMQPGLISTPYYTDDPLGISGWKPGIMSHLPSDNGKMSREIEPAWFYRNDGAVVMIFRDQNSTFRKLASVSRDNGVTWTTPVLINTPDSRAKQSAGNLPDGTAYMVNNPSGNKDRFPLVITLSKDGFVFDKAYLLRCGGKDLQQMRFMGRYKKAGYHYPKSVIWNDYLYVSYSVNKEDVEMTRIPIKALQYK